MADTRVRSGVQGEVLPGAPATDSHRQTPGPSTPLGTTEYRRACTITRRLRSSTLPPFAKGAKDGAPRVRGAVGGVQRTDLRYPCRAPTDAGSLDFTRASPSGRSFSTRGGWPRVSYASFASHPSAKNAPGWGTRFLCVVKTWASPRYDYIVARAGAAGPVLAGGRNPISATAFARFGNGSQETPGWRANLP